ncbi:MAG TPA: hypothetical protein VNL70_10070, partial [Tepidisphaeraceae bacterium]|nr:hypothetical protein [Tepidisphaeraceae bacterium]
MRLRMLIAGGLRTVLLAITLSGCAAGTTPQHPDLAVAGRCSAMAGLDAPQHLPELRATVAPPTGWTRQRLPGGARHTHQVWQSPTGSTAYGVIHFKLPFPVGHELLLWAFINEMRRDQGQAKLLEKRWDANLGGVRFVTEGGLYRVRTNLMVRGFDGWAVYAGTLRAAPILPDELALAERAREYTEVGAAKP